MTLSIAQLAAAALILVPAAAVLTGFFVLYPRRPDQVHWPMLISCIVVTACSLHLAGFARRQELHWIWYRWMAVGRFEVDFGVLVDGLSCSVLAMVSVVGALIHVYAVGYMREDRSFGRFFLYFHLFYLSMIGLLISSNYLQMYLFWEGVGLASYLLIGFWFERESARRAALKAFLTNRVGDFGFMLAILLVLGALGTTEFSAVFSGIHSIGQRRLTWVACLLVWAATAKSAQFPLYFWLPDAMEGPTPVSALMHAATMVTAGVFLLARSQPVLAAAPAVLPCLAVLGAGTAFLSAVVASVKTDLKRILAYSTISHLGLMMLALGLGAVGAAVFHLVAHGFFKALLFLCAGNILRGIGKSSADLQETGALRKEMPFTFALFCVGAFSLAGVFPLGGFFSKDRILEAVFRQKSLPLDGVFLLTLAAGAFYIFRMLGLVFLGSRPPQSLKHSREPGLWMSLPAAALALGAAALGAGGNLLQQVLHLSLGSASFRLSAAGLAAAAAGIAGAWWVSCLNPSWDWEWKRAYPRLAAWIEGDFGWQAWVQNAVALPAMALARWTAEHWEQRTLNAGAEGLAGRIRTLSERGSRICAGLLNEYLLWMLAGAAVLVWLAK